MEKLQVGVIYGGRSVEHEVSIISALQAIRALPAERYEAVPIYISKQGQWYSGDALLDLANYKNLDSLLAECRPVYFSPNYQDWQLLSSARQGLFAKPWQKRLDLAFPVIHGTFGEDGSLQGLLELSGIPYVGAAVLGSAIGMDKIVTKAILQEAGLPVTRYTWFGSHEWQSSREAVVKRILEQIELPLVVKPANLGSSVGISRVDSRLALEEAIDLAVSFSSRIIIEEAIEPLRELNCAVLGMAADLEISAIEEPLSANELLSFSDKYLSSGTKGMSGAKRRIPADITPEIAQKIVDLAKRTFSALDGQGVCRIDFLYNPQTEMLYVNEANTIPGSLAFYLFEPQGKSFSQLVDSLLQQALARYRDQQKLIYTYDSNILAQGGFKGKSR